MAREDILLREITTGELSEQIQDLRNDILTHDHLASGNSKVLSGIVTGDLQSSNYISGLSGWQIKGTGDAEFTNILVTGGIITGATFQTSTSGARVVITGNDAYFYDDTTGGSSPVTGDVASIYFPRTDDDTKRFVMQKRAGINFDDEDVMEMFYSSVAGDGRENYIFVGRAGDEEIADTKLDVISTNFTGVYELIHTAANTAFMRVISSGYSGAQGAGLFGLGDADHARVTFGCVSNPTDIVFTGSPTFAVGDTITGNGTGATALITNKTDANNYKITLMNGTFDPNVDDACTTNGGGGGSGTGILLFYPPPFHLILGNFELVFLH